MKKLILNLCTLLACCGASASDTWVVNNDGDTIWYDFNDYALTASVTFKGKTYNSYKNEYSDTIIIPENVEYNGSTYKVTSIGASAFDGCFKNEAANEEYLGAIAEEIDPDEMEEIDTDEIIVSKENFSERKSTKARKANGLKSVSIPNSVTTIGNSAFYECKNLKSVSMPDSVTQIGSNAFRLCSSLTNVTIPKGVTSISSKAFSGCENLTCVSIPEGVTTIGVGSFQNCSSLTKTTLPNSLKEIASEAFSNCQKLTNVSIPEGVTSIGYGAFYGCLSLNHITIPDGVTEIGKIAFYDCPNLKNVSIPSSVTTIGTMAFCSNINVAKDNPNYSSEDGVLFDKSKTTLIQYPLGKRGKYTIPNGVTKIAPTAFIDCFDLTSLTIPSSVTEIETSGNPSFVNINAFEYCSKLYEIYNFSSLNITPGSKEHGGVALYAKDVHTSKNAASKLKQVGDFTFYVTKDSIELLAYTGNASSVKLPQNFNGKKYQIAENAFVLHNDMKSVTIPDGVTKIGKLAFAECRGLKNITIPNSVTEIEERAFANCTALESVAISASVTKIETLTFYGCSKLKSVTIPSKVTMVGWGAFRLCDSLKNITCKNITPPECDDDLFHGLDNSVRLYVPTLSVDKYKEAVGWRFISEINGYK